MPNWKIGTIVITSLLVVGSWSISASAEEYPQLVIDGYKKWEYKNIDVTPPRNYFSGLTQIGGYSPNVSGGPWQERLQLKIMGKLSKELSVTYDLDQQPETPEKFDVKVTYDNREQAAGSGQAAAGLAAGVSELTFGDLNASFSGNEFASASKYLNGVMLKSTTDWYDVLVVPSAKSKSQTQALTSQKGNGTAGPYNLGHGSILDGSERIDLNGIPLRRNIDYTIDYFEGKITFINRMPSANDEFKYSFEYTNIIDLFFPSLSKRDFFGAQARFTINPEEFGQVKPADQLAFQAAEETFPTAASGESELLESESAGQYQLASLPVKEFSERLSFLGSELRKDVDYVIRYNEGKIKLLTRFLPTAQEPLVVNYQYYQSTGESETLAGLDSRGPYKLGQANLIPGSENVVVDGRQMVRDLDYTLNDQTGELNFGLNIGRASQIKADYRRKVKLEQAKAPPSQNKELKLGVTYLKESAKQGNNSPTATITEGFLISDVDENNCLFLTYIPISGESSSAITISVGGVVLTPEVDYVIPQTIYDPSTGYYTVTPEATLRYINDRTDPSNGFRTGTIKFLNHSLSSYGVTIHATYTYYKSIVSNLTVAGDGTRGPYYLRNVLNLVPGKEIVQVMTQGSSVVTIYNRNSSFETSGVENGYSINYDPNTPYVRFNEPLRNDQSFQIIYQYIPTQATAGGEIAQSVYGADSSFSLGNTFKADASFARSESDQVYSPVTTVESNLRGNGTKTLYLNSPAEIIEGSEIISINSLTLNRDIDYNFSYTSGVGGRYGSVLFYFVTPSTQDAISATYKYKSTDPDSGYVAGRTTKTGTAFRLGAQSQLFNDKLTISGTAKGVDRDFTPQGGTSIGQGSRYKEYSAKFQPGWQSLTADFAYRENANPLSNSLTRFLRSYDNSFSLGLNPASLGQINFNFRQYRAADDQAAGVTHESDTATDSLGLSLAPPKWTRGWTSFELKGDLKKDVSKTDAFDDNRSLTESTVDYQHLNAGLKATERFDLSFDFQQSDPTTRSRQYATAEVTSISSRTRTRDSAYRLALDLTPAFLRKLTANANLLNQESVILIKNFGATEEAAATKNETYRIDLVPIQILTLSADHSRQEKTALVVGGANPKTERTAGRVTLTPFGWLSAGWSGSQSETIPDGGLAYRTAGTNDTYDLGWSPINLPRFKFSSNFALTDQNQTAPQGTVEVLTETDSFSKNFSADLTLLPSLPLKFGLLIEDYANKNSLVAPTRIETKTQNETQTIGTTFAPIPPLTITSSYNKKTTKVLSDLTLAPQSRVKTVLDNKISYLLFAWGTVVYNRIDEKNGGEVQAGSVADLDLEKSTSSLSFNMNLPVDNAVLSSFTFIASLKSVNYKNLKNANDDFVANLMSFEGALNF